ncbi:MAG: hypothetical protein IKZ41_06030 [Clostridia bacterium]|nr:hypothetical protein [Clostridia bacterium]
MKKLTAFQRAVLDLLVTILLFQIGTAAAVFQWGFVSWAAFVGGFLFLIIRGIFWILESKLGSSDRDE